MKNQIEIKREEKPKAPRIQFHQAKYLKHVGGLNDVKVTIHLRGDVVCLHIRDFEFETFDSALQFLREDARQVMPKLEVVS